MATRKQLLDQNDNEILPITDTESVRNPQNIGGTLESRLEVLEEQCDNIPAISTNIETDATSETKAAAPKAVKTYVDSKVSSAYKAAGTASSVSNLGSLDASHEGFVYNMSAEFTTTANFVEGAGKTYPSGTNVAIVNVGTAQSPSYKYDVMSGFVDLSGKADKSEMSVTDGTGADADKTTIQLKNGTSATVLKQHQDISGKVDKVSGATPNNFASFDSNGGLQDSGKKAADFAKAVSITYAALKALRDAGNLVPGTWYRITDYVCTTTQDNTQSAEHAFDVIVRADDTSHLNENAFAAHHEGDEYFANCKLEAWELKYCLDNDTNRFAWADDENGTGVIFYMKDEWNNECPYDFKNIMFKRWAVTEYEKCPSLVVDSQDNNNGYYYGAMQLNGESQVLENATYGEDFGWFYTFALKDLATENWYDYTVVAHLGLKNDEGGELACYDNHLEPGTDEYSSGKGEMAKMLNNIVFFNCFTDLSDTSYADDYSYCNNNRFLGNCHSNTFGNDFQNNSFGNDCRQNSFGNNCYSNSFGNNCGGNTFGNYFQYNSFGNSCSGNTFGNNCYSNSFGNSCNNNSFGNECYQNSFGNYCTYNSFGNNCYSNSFGNYCYSNSFGNDCRQNSFGNGCNNNSFGNYCQSITVFDSVQYCSVTGGSQNAPVKNAQILNGTAGASSANKLTIAFAANKAYTQVAAKNTSGNLKIFNPADLT